MSVGDTSLDDEVVSLVIGTPTRADRLHRALSMLMHAFPELNTAPTTQTQQDALRAAREALR